MIRVLLVLGVLFGSAVGAQAQDAPCRTEGQSKVFGCLDRIQDGSGVVYQSQPTILYGWALSCYPAQQPSHVEVWTHDGQTGTQLTRDQFAIAWRGYRPDVAAYFRRTCNTQAPYFGYAIVIHPNVLALETRGITVLFFDPAMGPGLNEQHRAITVRQLTR